MGEKQNTGQAYIYIGEYADQKYFEGRKLKFLDGLGRTAAYLYLTLRGFPPRKQNRKVNGRYKKVNVYHSKKDRVILELAWQQQENLNKTIDIIHQHQD